MENPYIALGFGLTALFLCLAILCQTKRQVAQKGSGEDLGGGLILIKIPEPKKQEPLETKAEKHFRKLSKLTQAVLSIVKANPGIGTIGILRQLDLHFPGIKSQKRGQIDVHAIQQGIYFYARQKRYFKVVKNGRRNMYYLINHKI